MTEKKGKETHNNPKEKRGGGGKGKRGGGGLLYSIESGDETVRLLHEGRTGGALCGGSRTEGMGSAWSGPKSIRAMTGFMSCIREKIGCSVYR